MRDPREYCAAPKRRARERQSSVAKRRGSPRDLPKSLPHRAERAGKRQSSLRSLPAKPRDLRKSLAHRTQRVVRRKSFAPTPPRCANETADPSERTEGAAGARAQGNALGNRRRRNQALKGRSIVEPGSIGAPLR